MRKKKRNLILSEWDKKLFVYLHQRKVALMEQINRDLPKFKDINSTRIRLYKLKKAGFLKAHYSNDHPKKIALSITKKTFSDFINNGDCIRKELGSGKVEHDLALVDIRHIISKSEQVKQYLSENELQSFDTYYSGKTFSPFIRLRTDAVIEHRPRDISYWVAIEYEASKKSLGRYKELLRSYYSAVDIPAVLYICESNQIQNMIMREEKLLKPKEGFKFYYKTLEELKLDPSLTFTRQDGISTSLTSNPL